MIQSRLERPDTTKSPLDKALGHIESLKADISRAEDQIVYLEEERACNEDERDRLEAGFRKLQQHVFRQFESPNWKPDTNSTVQRKLSQLGASVKNWSRHGCLPKIHSLKADKCRTIHKNLRKAIRDFIDPDNEPGFAYLSEGKEWVVIHAHIMHHLYFDIFCHPFFGISDQPAVDIDGQTDDNSNQIMSTKRHDETEHSSESLRLLYSKFRACK
jgi:hypothetical protein